MTLLPPRFSRSSKPRDDALDYEIAQEQAAALGRLGRALEAALAALSDYDRSHAERGKEPAPVAATLARAELVRGASDALWCFIIQREACGLRDLSLIMREYGVPAEVQNRMGVFGGDTPRRSPRK